MNSQISFARPRRSCHVRKSQRDARKRSRLGATALVIALTLSASPGQAQIVPFDSERWEIDAGEGRVETYMGRQSLYLRGGLAWITDDDFTNGILEFDIAFSEQRGFMGGIWRLQDPGNYEEFYMRPHQAGNPDANQYTPVINGVSGWQLYHGPRAIASKSVVRP